MIAPETSVALANQASIARGQVLVIGFGPELARALPDAVVFHQDLRAHRASEGSLFGAWIETDRRFDSVVIELPRAVARTRLLLAMTRTVMREDASVFLIGRNDAGIRSAGPNVDAAIGAPEVLDYRHHCRVITAAREVRDIEHGSLDDWLVRFHDTIAGREIHARSFPGVFAHGRVDEGTHHLLATVAIPAGARALDVGSGSGIIGAWLRATGVSVDCVDSDALAVEATQRTLELNGAAQARVWASDAYSDVPDRYDHIVTNAPFHAGARTTLGVAAEMIRRAPDHLGEGGHFWMVANRFLDHLPVLRETFGTVDVTFEDSKFRVYHACAR